MLIDFLNWHAKEPGVVHSMNSKYTYVIGRRSRDQTPDPGSWVEDLYLDAIFFTIVSPLGLYFLLISFHTNQQLSMRDLPYLSQRLQMWLPPLAFMVTEVMVRGSVCNCIAGRLMACTWRKQHPPGSSQLF